MPGAASRDTGSNTTVDVLIIGAGVAGLAALRVLADAGISARVLEARDRIGGRIHTLHDERLPHAIELGAEFIHGSAPKLVQLTKEAGLTPLAIEGKRWRARGDRLVRMHDFWQEMHKVMRHLPEKGDDLSFADFLRRAPGGPSAGEARALSKQFVEGFHAAETEKISARALAEGGAPSEDSEEQRLMRIPTGYDGVPQFLARGLASRISVNTVVESIEWERKSVSIAARGKNDAQTIRARAAIVTVPLAVLFAPAGEQGAIMLQPSVPVIGRMRSKLTMGSVQKAFVLFKERWWTEKLRSTPKDASLDSLSFLHGETRDYPVWWTLHPAHLPAMVGWSGGPSALPLAGKPYEEKRDRALAALAKNMGVTKRRLESQLVHLWTHDWDTDPFSRGAYSYSLVGGANAAARFAQGIEGTLWFAGEAADAEGRNGTVNGAIGSGRAAAQAVKRSMG